MDNTFTPLKKYMESQGQSFNMNNLNTLAQSKGLNNFTATDDQNKQLFASINQSVKTMPAPTVAPSAITPESMNTKALNIPVTQPQVVSQPFNYVDQLIQSSKVELSPVEKQAQDIQYRIANMLPEMQGEQLALTQAREQVGVNKYMNELQGLNTEIHVKTAELAKSDIELAQSLQNIEDKPIAMEFITGQQASVQRNAQLARALKSSEIGILNARALATQGNIGLAQQMASDAVTARFAPQKEAINLYKAQLEAIAPIVSSAQKERMQEQEVRTTLALKRIDREEKSQKDIQDMLVNASSQNAPADLVTRAGKAKTQVEAAIILGAYSGDYIGNLAKKTAIAKSNSDIAKNYAEIAKTRAEIKTLQTPIPAYNVPGSNANTFSNLLNSAVNKDSLSQTERTAVSKNLSVLDQLDSLQVNIAKQNKTGFIKGNVNNFLASIGQNADVGVINAQLQAIVPNLARGVYGEVGVLTDNDIANYRKTLPTLIMPKDQNDAVLALTLRAVQKNLKNTLETAANSKMDVSRFAPQYQLVSQRINEINDRIGTSDIQVKDYADKNPNVRPMVEDLIKKGKTGSQILQVLGVEY